MRLLYSEKDLPKLLWEPSLVQLTWYIKKGSAAHLKLNYEKLQLSTTHLKSIIEKFFYSSSPDSNILLNFESSAEKIPFISMPLVAPLLTFEYWNSEPNDGETRASFRSKMEWAVHMTEHAITV